MQWSLEELGMTAGIAGGWFGCTAIQEIWMQVAGML